jgi:prophage maintenance system killer protein
MLRVVADANVLISAALADSDRTLPAAAFGGTEFDPDVVEKTAVPIVRHDKNHPLPDGNNRAAWVSLRMFIEISRWPWTRMPDANQAERAVLAIAAGEWNEQEDRGLAGRPDHATALVNVEPARRPASDAALASAGSGGSSWPAARRVSGRGGRSLGWPRWRARRRRVRFRQLGGFGPGLHLGVGEVAARLRAAGERGRLVPAVVEVVDEPVE